MKLFSIISPSFNHTELKLMCGPHDGIILRQDAVYLCLRDDICWPTQQMFVLDSDLAVRQVCAPSYISVVSAAHWVELCSKATQNILWQN